MEIAVTTATIPRHVAISDAPPVSRPDPGTQAQESRRTGPEHAERSERTERPEHAGRPERAERSEHAGRGEEPRGGDAVSASIFARRVEINLTVNVNVIRAEPVFFTETDAIEAPREGARVEQAPVEEIVEEVRAQTPEEVAAEEQAAREAAQEAAEQSSLEAVSVNIFQVSQSYDIALKILTASGAPA
ncbi:MAG: hypothetical protein ACWA5A_16210 [Marinibacterium sp.]